MRIGELAARVGVTPDTIRYYEREGLLPRAPRTGGGYRMYDRHALTDLAFIQKAQAAGLALREIREVLDICAEGRPPCDHVRATVRGRLEKVERRMRDLRALRMSLRATLRRLDRVPEPSAGCQCPAIEATPAPRSPRGSPVRHAGGGRRGAA
jgi:DNA-binding transcriptional MerR regulator